MINKWNLINNNYGNCVVDFTIFRHVKLRWSIMLALGQMMIKHTIP